MRINWGIIAVLSLSIAVAVRGDVSITPMSAIVENQIVGGERRIKIAAAGTPSIVVTVTATSGTNPVEYIKVASALTAPFTSANVVLMVAESGAHFPISSWLMSSPPLHIQTPKSGWVP